MKCYMANQDSVERRWLLIDAEGKTLGRLASEIATRLRGKDKPCFTPHVDCGDFVVAINVEKISVTGKKMSDKIYHRHTGYPGGIKSRTLAEMLERSPVQVIEKAVKGMLPKGPLGRQMLRKFKAYAGSEHPHEAQQPQKIMSNDKGEE